MNDKQRIAQLEKENKELKDDKAYWIRAYELAKKGKP